jgi:hypothetical protein
MIGAIAYPWHGRWAWGLTPPAAGSGTTQHPVPLLVGWVQHTLIRPSAWNRYSSTFGLTLWIVLLTPSAQPTQISASLSLKDPEAAPSSERSAPKTSIKRSADESHCAAKFPVFSGYAEHWRRALYTLAGRFAEQLEILAEIHHESWEEFSEEAEIEAEHESRRGDTFHLMEHLYGMGDFEEEYPVVVSDTEERVRELWPEITAVAEILMERGRLEGDEVARIIECAREQQKRRG